MLTRNRQYIAAVLGLAVVALGLGMAGCVTPARIDQLEEQVIRTQQQNEQSQKLLRNIDTTVATEANENRRLRADMSVTIDQLELQISQLQSSYADLLQRIDQLYQALETKGQLRSSAGTVPQGSNTTTPNVPPAMADDDAECTQNYDDAFVLMRRAEYDKAIEEFNRFLGNCPNHQLAENAHYWIGESYYSLGKFAEAIEQLEALLKNYKASSNTARALFKLGRSQEELGKKKDAKATFQRLVDDHAGTLEAEQAKERLKSL